MEGVELIAPETPRFNPFEAIVGVIARPVITMRAIAAARPWPFAVGLYVAIALLSGLVNLTAPLPFFSGVGAPPAGLPDGFEGGDPLAGLPPGFGSALAFLRSPWYALLIALVFAPIGLLFTTGILYLIGRILGGQGRFSALLSTVSFASVPGLVLAPLTAVLNLLAGQTGQFALSALATVLSLGFAVWGLVLQALGIRESLSLSTGRAVATLLIPIAILIALGCGVALLIFGLLFASLSNLSAP